MNRSKKVYFVSTEASPLERQLYSVKLNGKDRTRISQGAGTHEISMGPTAEYYLDTFSSLTEPPRKTVHNARGDEWAVFREAKHKLTDEYAMQPPEIVNFKGSDGTLLYGRLIKPANFHAGEKYPGGRDGVWRPGRSKRPQRLVGRRLGAGAGRARICDLADGQSRLVRTRARF